MRPGTGVLRDADPIAHDLVGALAEPTIDIARAALVIARLEYPRLDPRPSLAELTRLGDLAAVDLQAVGPAPVRERIAALNRLLFDRERFLGNRAQYDDFRNSFLNVVLERRLGIPISLAVVYMVVARRAGLDVEGVSFPGHFLLRVAGDHAAAPAVILDPFDAGAELDESGCRALLARAMGDDAPYDASLMSACTPRQLVARMLNNLKRTYVELRSFQQAYRVTDLLLAADPTLLSERRDRGLLAYHLDDYPAALSDLEDYVRLNAWADAAAAPDTEERDQIWEHIKTLRRRVASMN
jgi:regulator of sirC expression with transglutaminase-like and TPR domain